MLLDELIQRLQERVLNLLVTQRGGLAGLVVVVFGVAPPHHVLVFRGRRPRFPAIPRPTLTAFQSGREQTNF